MDIVDISLDQLYLTELRLSALRSLNYSEWLSFMGYHQQITPKIRKELFETLILSKGCKAYWKKYSNMWPSEGFIYLGRWEKFFLNLGKVSRLLLLVKFDKFFEAHDLNQQRDIYLKHWPRKRFHLFLKIASSKEFMNRFLYRGSFSGQSTSQHIEERYRSLFLNHPMKKNFFMQMLFLGKIPYDEAFPLEAQAECFEKAKKSQTVVNFIHASVTEALAAKPYDFYHMSDVLSYLGEADAHYILKRCHADVPTKALFVSRLFIKGPKDLATSGWKQRADLEDWASRKDETGVYDFRIYEKYQ